MAMGSGGRLVVVGVVAAAVVLNCAAASARSHDQIVSAAIPGDATWVEGPGIDSANDNAQTGGYVEAAITPGWSREDPSALGSAPATAPSISVTPDVTFVINPELGFAYLSAYSTATGNVLWRRRYDGPRITTAYVSHGLVYMPDADGNVHVFRLDYGAPVWTAYDGIANWYRDAAVGDGIVVTSSWVDDARTGAHLYTAGVNESGAAVISGGRYYLNGPDSVQAFDPRTGTELWSYAKSTDPHGPGFGTLQPALHRGRLYVRGDYQTLVLDAATGQPLPALPHSDAPLALNGNTGIFSTEPSETPATLTGVNLRSGAVEWTHTFSYAPNGVNPEQLWATPIVEDHLVWALVGWSDGAPGTIYALDETTGAVESATTLPCNAADGMLVIAQHRLFTSSGCGLLTFTNG